MAFSPLIWRTYLTVWKDSMCCSLEKGNEKMRIEKFILQYRGVLSLKFI
jgi:hypothetical protein